ncbi:PEP-CTERM sorting domain-containing protein [Aeoliella sp. ICT_H6.2]|uniref:PEP-CTERM sorting domain-containing protein n=1 Tax=Aeoliella straminimaris TaxID=2954799 RepID=A0A9X2FDE2_9BACT|nr:PEP-CTERM sorting domain-containing protein [Aeoliella straminimaris]MCO6046539.1 PEP-CTERM sorting domain-containing protein [Aeoliella straminimaris]
MVKSEAATVTTTGRDGFGASSFNSAGIWSDASAPSAGNDYIVDDEDRVRTPADGSSYTFAGDSLEITAVGSGGDLNIAGLSYKGTGNTGTITVDNLILNGGSINHISGVEDIFNLGGTIDVVSDSIIYAKQGPINILSPISGSATITNPGSDGDGRTVTLASSGNTFTGSIVNEGRFALADDAVMNFVVGASGVNNSISGGGPQTALDGDFVIDLSGASTNLGDNWGLVTASSAAYGSTFSIAGFTEAGPGIWTSSANGATYAFETATGSLSVVPEPSSIMMLCGALTMLGYRKLR